MSHDSIDPELRAFYSRPLPDVNAANLMTRRGNIGSQVAALLSEGGAPPEVRLVDHSSEVEQVSIRIHRPSGDGRSLPAIVHIHAGGFVMGSAAMSDGANRDRAEQLQAVVISIEYRLAPEAVFPAQLEDCYTALRWVSENAPDLGVDADRIAILGESAGGGLAAALAILARDRGGPALVGQFLLYPMLDCRTGTSEGVQNPRSGVVGWSHASNQFGWQSMRGDKAIGEHEMGYFSPALAADLSSLPPTYIVVGELDILVDDSIAFVSRLVHAGVPTEFHLYPRAPHAFDYAPGAGIADRFKADLAAALFRTLAG